MHITHVNFARGFRGGERQTLNLIEGLASSGVQQVLVCRPGSELAQRIAPLAVKLHEVSHPLCGHLVVPKTDLIHVHEARGAYWAAIEQGLRETPYVITRRVPNPISDSVITRATYQGAAALFGVSKDVSRILAGQVDRHVHTILSSSSFRQVDPAEVAALRMQLGAGQGPIIGHVGALHDAHKGQRVLIEGFFQLLDTFPQARLVLVGEGPDREQFSELARRDPRIIFTGFQPRVDLWTAAFDVFAFPSREEGLGSSVLDAMALGVPVVASTAGGLPELIGANQRGMAVASRSPRAWSGAIAHLLGDPHLRSRLVGAARSFALENNVSAMSSAYLRTYEGILQRRPAMLLQRSPRPQG